jgi:CRP-like cAMP-binding protein
MRDQIREVLREHPFLRDFEPHHIEMLAEAAQEIQFEKDQILFRELDSSNTFCLIVSGKVALEVNALGRTLRVQTVSDGETLGWSSLMLGEGKYFQARALGVVRALVFDGARLRDLCDKDCSLGYKMMKRLLKVVAGRLQSMRIQLLDMYSPGGGKES